MSKLFQSMPALRLATQVFAGISLLSIPSLSHAGNIENGDFSKGNQDVYSDYYYLAPGDQNTEEGQYAIDTDPSLYNSAWDGPAFSQNAMIVNGIPTPDQVVWGGTTKVGFEFDVSGNTAYTFSLDICNLYDGPPATLELKGNDGDDPISTDIATAGDGGRNVWVHQTFTFIPTLRDETFYLIDTNTSTRIHRALHRPPETISRSRTSMSNPPQSRRAFCSSLLSPGSSSSSEDRKRKKGSANAEPLRIGKSQD